MGYPTPDKKYFYRYINEKWYIDSSKKIPLVTWELSRQDTSPLLKSYQDFIIKHSKFLKNIPFVAQVYLCNSITFNGLRQWSDIDICIVTAPWFLWFARARSWIFFYFLDLKRHRIQKEPKLKFCLSFYIDGNNTNLTKLRNQEWDVYLSYRLAHCVLLYTNHIFSDNHIFRSNSQLLSYLPFHPLLQTISLEIPIVRWSTRFKNMIEFLLSTKLWLLLQKLIQKIRGSGINNRKISQLPLYQQKHIIVSSTMLKFYNDKRKIYQQNRKTMSTKSSKNDN